MAHEIVALRTLTPPRGYMTLETAEAAGVRIPAHDRAYCIGPLRRGVIYWCAYWRTVNTVHDVFVRVRPVRDKRGRFAGQEVCGFLVAEENNGDTRVRVHSTAWKYGRGNAALLTIG